MSALIGVLYVLPYIVMQLKAGGLLAQRLFADAEPWQVFGLELSVFDLGTGAPSIVASKWKWKRSESPCSKKRSIRMS